MKKLLTCLLLLFANLTNSQHKDSKTVAPVSKSAFADVKSSLADNAIMFGSVAIVAGGCFVGRKQIGGLAWVTKKYFDKKFSELVCSVHSIRTDIMQTKSHLHSRVEVLGRDMRDGFEGLHAKLDAQNKVLVDLTNQVEKLQQDVMLMQKDVNKLACHVPNKLDKIQSSINDLVNASNGKK